MGRGSDSPVVGGRGLAAFPAGLLPDAIVSKSEHPEETSQAGGTPWSQEVALRSGAATDETWGWLEGKAVH